MMDRTKIYKYSPAQNNSTSPEEPTTVVPANTRAPKMEGGNCKKKGFTWNIKHEISSPKFYEPLIKKGLKRDTALDLKNFYNKIKMCLNLVTIIQEEPLPDYQSIKRHFEFE